MICHILYLREAQTYLKWFFLFQVTPLPDLKQRNNVFLIQSSNLVSFPNF